MKIETIETILVALIVIIQLTIFLRTRSQIKTFKGIIPEVELIEVSKIFLSLHELNTQTSDTILTDISGFEDQDRVRNVPELSRKEIAIVVDRSEKKNSNFKKILDSINTYLIRNYATASDFNLIKDITERNADALEEEINLTISIPLFLGLMGTMLGIVISLFSMSDLSLTFTGKAGDDPLGQGITVLLGGVKIAMIASFTGLLLTTVNSGWAYKGSKRAVEANKNEFYSFIQTELLPVINQSLGSVFESLQRNLSKFNEEFANNLTNLSGTFETQFYSIASLEKILVGLENIDISKIATYNVQVLKELQSSMEAFEKFNSHASNISSSLENSTTLVDRINDLLERTEDVQAIANRLDTNLTTNQELLEFLSQHFKMLDEYKQKTSESIAQTGFSISEVFSELKGHIEKSSESVKNFTKESTATTGFSITETFSQLKEHIENSSKTLKDFTVEEVELLKKAMSESKTNLVNLQYLEAINEDVTLLKNSTASQGERIRMLLLELNKNLANSNRILNNIERNSLSASRKGIRNYLKQLFYSNKETSQNDPQWQEQQLQKLQQQLQELQRKEQQQQEILQQEPRPGIVTNREIFYLSTPSQDACFYAKSAQSQYKEGTSIYRFTKISDNQAEFQIDERETSISLALESPDINIDRVCDAQNSRSSSEKRIVTLEVGKAELNGNRWKVTSRALIRYEH